MYECSIVIKVESMHNRVRFIFPIRAITECFTNEILDSLHIRCRERCKKQL